MTTRIFCVLQQVEEEQDSLVAMVELDDIVDASESDNRGIRGFSLESGAMIRISFTISFSYSITCFQFDETGFTTM